MADEKLDSERLMNTRSLIREAGSHIRSVNYLQSRIDDYNLAVRNRMDGMVDCLKKVVFLFRDQNGFADLQLGSIIELRPPVAPVVYDLTWKKVGRATFAIHINGNHSKPVVLTRQEWEFLKFLAQNHRDPTDGLVATRKLDELIAHLSSGKSRTGDPRKYVNHMVSRLRIALGNQGFDPDIIRRDDQLGVRFAFRGRF
jgi:hypothetical protein